MKKILFPTDFSDTATNAFVYSLQLAKKTGAELYVLHTYEMPIVSDLSAGQPELVHEVYTSIELNHFDNFRDETPKLRAIAQEIGASEVEMTFVFEEGSLIRSIRNVISAESIDLVVMGTNGESGFEKKLFGSNTLNTIKSIEVPILSVPHLAKFREIKKIGFTTLFKESDRKPLGEILKIAQSFDAGVRCLHVTKETDDPIIELSIRDWTRWFSSNQLKFIVEKQGSLKVDQHIAEFIENFNIDFLAIVKRNQNFFERLFSSSLSSKLSLNLKTPILIIKEEK